MPDRVGVVICDDNPSVRLALSRSLKHKKDLAVVGDVPSVDEMLALVRGGSVDVVVLDVNMPGTSGLDGIARLREAGSGVAVIIMSADRRNESMASSVGAASFFYKGTSEISALVDQIKAAAGAV